MKQTASRRRASEPPSVFRWFGPVLVTALAITVAVLGYVVAMPLIHL
jgi:hypothetical protein